MKVIVVAGARPNFMKVAPILAAFARRDHASPRLVHTGQHYGTNMSDDFFDELGIPAPDINLEVGSGTHAEQTGRIMIAFENVCMAERPECVLVVGDVNSTLACAIAARKLNITVAHVEAGLRSRDMTMPEEINRLCTDAISDLLFTTDQIANANLRHEGVAEERIQFVGNTMIDTLYRHIDRAKARPLPAGLAAGEYAVFTLHRPGNVDSRQVLSGIMESVHDLAKAIPIVFPIHPRTLKNLNSFGLTRPGTNLQYTEPLSYLPFLGLVANSRMVLTDSGGIQEETTALGVPCLTMRPNTERPITCELGTNILVGNDPECIRREAFAVLNGTARAGIIPEKWDGHAGERIVNVLLSRTAEYQPRIAAIA